MVATEQKTIIKGTLWGMAGGIALKVVSFVYLVLTTRLFSQESVGTFYLGLSIINMLAIFGDFGLTLAFSRFVPYYLGRGEKDKALALLKGSYTLVTLFSVVLTAGLILAAGPIAAFYRNPGLEWTLVVLALSILVNALLSLNTCVLLSLKNVKDQNVLNNGQNTLKLIVTVALFVLWGASAGALAGGYALATLLTALASFILLKTSLDSAKLGSKISVSQQIDVLKETIPFGLVLAAITGMWMILSSIDRMMLGYMLSPPEEASAKIAIYTVAVTLAGVIGIFTSAIMAIFLPTISELYGKGKKDEMSHTSNFANRWIVILMVPATVLMVCFPEQLLTLFYGASYAPGAAVVVIFTLGLFARGMSYVHGSLLAALRIVRVELVISAAAMVLNVVLNYALIPEYGIEGAAFASALSLASVSLALFYYTRKLAGGTFLAGTLKPLVAAAATCLIFLLLKDYLAVAFSLQVPKIAEGLAEQVYEKFVKLAVFGLYFLLACGTYLLLMLAFRAFGKEDRELMTGALRRVRVPEPHIALVEGILGAEHGN